MNTSKPGCVCGKMTEAERIEHYRVFQRCCNHSAFNSYHYTPSDYSSVHCLRCRRAWRTKAAYVALLKDMSDKEMGINR